VRSTTGTRLARVLGGLAGVGIAIALVVTGWPAGDRTAAAADLSAFDAGNIISDAIFFDSTTMSAASIDAFLDAKGAGCVAGAAPCLKDFRQTTWTRSADSRCARTYTGAANESAGTIIAKVATACGINPQVLVVMLQKEQGLVTGSRPSTTRYDKAMGYGCPDTAACDTKYYGFFNQVYSAASQLQNYTKNPTRYAHQVGMTNNVRYSPNAACGTKAVYIQNQATADLYNYTPYTPNAAALAAGYGLGDGCSAYGNRNFWNYFRDWFGPTTDRQPFGFIDSMRTTDGAVVVNGWALDPDTTAPIAVHVYVDGVAQAFTANATRTDVDAVYHKGAAHGFVASAVASAGKHEVCVWALNDWSRGGNVLIGCRTVTVVNHLPIGELEVAEGTPGAVRVDGWAYDPDTSGPATVTVSVDGAVTRLQAGLARTDLASSVRRTAIGFDGPIAIGVGPHKVCVSVLDTATGAAVSLGCRTVTSLAAADSEASRSAAAVWPMRLSDTWLSTAPAVARCVAPSRIGVPANATGVTLNVTSADPTSAGHVVVFPWDGSSAPTSGSTSTLNLQPGLEVANAAFVRLGTAGKICWTAVDGGNQRVILDVTGYTTSGSGASLVEPVRLLDSRSSTSGAELAGGIFLRTASTVQITGRAGVPAGATAAILNITVVDPAAAGHVTVYATGSSATAPGVTTVAFSAGRTTASAALVRLGDGGKVTIWADAPTTARLQIVIDVSGYLSTGSVIDVPTPVRVLDTRAAAPASLRLASALVGDGAATVDVVAGAGIPADATAVVVELTAVRPTVAGNLRVYPGGSDAAPTTSTLNYSAGSLVSNLAFVPLSADGTIDVRAFQADGGKVDIVVDVVGYVR
jgi:hypothetical protein